MKRCVFILPVVGIAALVLFLESAPRGAPIRDGLREWLAANAQPAQPEMVTALELPQTRGGIRALDAALILRAILRCEPKAVVFLDPIEPGESEALLLSKLGDAKMPVVFTSNAGLDPLPRVTISQTLPSLPTMVAALPEGRAAGGARVTTDELMLVAARQGDHAVPSNAWRLCMAVDGLSAANVAGEIPGTLREGSLFAPVNAAGCARINPLASRFVQRIAFDQLMLRTERSEQGTISVDLDALFRGRVAAVQMEGENRALGLAALRNGLAESALPLRIEWIGWLLVATLPWWRGSRIHRALVATGVSCAWALMALAVYQEFRIALPLPIMALLPLLALIPPAAARSNKIEQRELPA